MFDWEIKGKRFHVSEARTQTEFHVIEEIQREAWGFSDLDIVPAATLVATQWCGAIVLCAYEASEMIGFVYGFPAFENRKVSLHSHMLAVRPGWRNYQAGFFLKLAQRNRAVEMGLDEITWTFDPLQSLNAHLNFSKLGVISRRYLVDFYGEATSSPLHSGFGTDRLWVSWLLTSERVQKRIDRIYQSNASSPETTLVAESPENLPLLVRAQNDRPELGDIEEALSSPACLIEIPNNITALKASDPALGKAWREATREAFLAAIEPGFIVEDLVCQPDPHGPRWFYKLIR
jgi:predicted GNAT superfamily acetyltransferase